MECPFERSSWKWKSFCKFREQWVQVISSKVERVWRSLVSELWNEAARSSYQDDPTLRTCREWNQIEQDRTNRDLGKRSPKGSRIRKSENFSNHIFEYSMNTVELCKVRTTPCSRNSGKWFSQKTSNRKAVRSNPIQGFYKTNKNKEQSSILKESMPKQHGFGTIQDYNNLRPSELKDVKKII